MSHIVRSLLSDIPINYGILDGASCDYVTLPLIVIERMVLVSYTFNRIEVSNTLPYLLCTSILNSLNFFKGFILVSYTRSSDLISRRSTSNISLS